MRAWLSAQWALFQASFPAISAWILGNLRAILVLAAGIIFFSLAIHSCTSSPSGTPTPGAGWFFLKLAFAGLIVAAVVSRDRPYLAWTFSGLAVLIFLVLLGKLDSIFVWEILGLPIFAAAGIYGCMKTDGRTRSFLGFMSGVVILAWFYLFAQTKLSVKLDFLGDRITDNINLVIFFLTSGLFIFATWKRSKVFYLISFIVLAAWLGNEVFNRIADRYPDMLKISIPSGVVELGNATNERLKIIAEQVKNPPPPKQNDNPPPISKGLAIGDIYADHQFDDNKPWDIEIVPGKYIVSYEIDKASGKKIGISSMLDTGKYSGYIPSKELAVNKKQTIRIQSDVKQKIVLRWNGNLS